MIKNITFSNFRGLQKLTLSNLEQITLISGKNNAGKSSILEGIFLFIDHLSPESFRKICYFRGLPTTLDQSTLWDPIFYHLDSELPISISVDLDNTPNELRYFRENNFVPADEDKRSSDVWTPFISSTKSTYSLKFVFTADDYTEEGLFAINSSGMLLKTPPASEIKPLPFVQYINALIITNDHAITEWFGKLELQGKKEQVINILKKLDPSISDISTIALKGQTQLYAKMNDKLMPLKLAGEGLNKLLFIILAIIENPDSFILIDEIENGFHYSMYSSLWRVIAAAARENNCQIIATTHSYECIEGAIDGINEVDMQDQFCLYRIEKNRDRNKAFRYSGSMLRSAIDSSLEVR